MVSDHPTDPNLASTPPTHPLPPKKKSARDKNNSLPSDPHFLTMLPETNIFIVLRVEIAGAIDVVIYYLNSRKRALLAVLPVWRKSGTGKPGKKRDEDLLHAWFIVPATTCWLRQPSTHGSLCFTCVWRLTTRLP